MKRHYCFLMIVLFSLLLINAVYSQHRVIAEESSYGITSRSGSDDSEFFSIANPPNIILMIGDGMGPEHLRAASLVEYGSNNGTIIDKLPVQSLYNTSNYEGKITDSAASATAMATGELTENSRIGMDYAGKRSIKTILEYLKMDLGYATGLITTTRPSHATPAAFAAHQPERSLETKIKKQVLETGVDLILGGGLGGLYWGDSSATQTLGKTYGYYVVNSLPELQQAPLTEKVLGIFPNEDYLPWETERDTSTVPGILDMTNFSLNYMDAQGKPFFLMIEGGRIDHAGHSNDILNDVVETIMFERAVRMAYKYALTHPNTVLIVGADHETGGLDIYTQNPQDLGDALPQQGFTRSQNMTLRTARVSLLNYSYHIMSHTNRLVRFAAFGADFTNVEVKRVNDIFWAMNSVLGRFPVYRDLAYSLSSDSLLATTTLIDKDNSTNKVQVTVFYENNTKAVKIENIDLLSQESFSIQIKVNTQQNFTWYLSFIDPYSFTTTTFRYKHITTTQVTGSSPPTQQTEKESTTSTSKLVYSQVFMVFLGLLVIQKLRKDPNVSFW